MPAQHRTRTPWAKLAAALAVLTVAALAVGGATLATADPDVEVDASASVTTSSAPATPVRVILAEKNGSGVSGVATVTGPRVVASADGLDPDAVYYSYVYGAGSSSGGRNPCILTGERGVGPVDTVGRWHVDDVGHGTLTGRITLSQLDAGTLSIRRNDTGTRGLAGPTPLDPLVACGHVGPRRTTALGQVQDQLPAVKVPATAVPTTSR